jgi:8-oxo-dGTP diphosphatase
MIFDKIQFCPRCGTALIELVHSGKLRPVCPACKWVYFPDPKVAVVVLIRKSEQVLLVQRKYDPQKGHWTLPSGFVDAGEDPKAAAVREVFFSREYPRGASILILYQAQVKSGELKAGDDANQATYFHILNLPPLAFSSTHQILDIYY